LVGFAKPLKIMVARDGVEPPTPAFSELIFSVFPTTSRVVVGLLNTGKYEEHGWIVGDCGG
jgi:predicted AlkP superfamily pyrophosphatase or phosphodiesterase